MIRTIILGGLVVLAACNTKSKTGTTDSGDKKGTDTVLTPGKDSLTVTGQTDTEKVDLVSLGTLKLGQSYRLVQETIGPPDSKSKATEWAADGLLHEDWTWKKSGLVMNMSSDKNNKDSTLAIFSITAIAPCDLKTKAGIGIGSSHAEVEAAYKDAIDPYSSNKDMITVGDLYGGIFLTFRDEKVVKLFLGAKAE
jgi:hypothetical protein